MVNIEIDGKKIQANDGAMIIEAADEARHARAFASGCPLIKDADLQRVGREAIRRSQEKKHQQ